MATRERILDTAQELVQLRGYNGFSYADISSDLAISKPSVHHHFPTKADLARELVMRYRERFDAARDQGDDPTADARERLRRYASLYAEVFTRGGRMCLCGVLAADATTLPIEVRELTAAFFSDQRSFIAKVLRASGADAPRARRSAETFLAGLEGSLLLARASNDSTASATTVDRVALSLLDALL